MYGCLTNCDLRTLYAAMHFNENSNRKQAITEIIALALFFPSSRREVVQPL